MATMCLKNSYCIVCGKDEWLTFVNPNLNRSVRSDGVIVEHPLYKSQCQHCGLIKSIDIYDADKLTSLYTQEYDIYNNRPNAEQFVTGRYHALAKTFCGCVPFSPKYVLEVGCGHGETLRAVQSIWRDATCIGLEPVPSAVALGKQNGLSIYEGMIGNQVPEAVSQYQYDVIYSVHVIEHTQDPVGFLTGLKSMLNPNGMILISCPNAMTPNLEMTRTDHIYSMTPYHLSSLVQKAGLFPVASLCCPGGTENIDYDYNQLFACTVTPSQTQTMKLPLNPLNADELINLYHSREKYLSAFGQLDQLLQTKLEGFDKVFCFGSGGWACILAGYAPNVWQSVQACVIDGGSDLTFHDKPIISYADLKSYHPDAVLVGTNPAIQEMISHRLETQGFKSIRWDEVIRV